MASDPQTGHRVSLDVGSRSAAAGQWLALAVAVVGCGLAAPEHWGSRPSPAAWLRIFAIPALLGWALLALWQSSLTRMPAGRRRWGWGPAWLTGQAALGAGLFACGWIAPYPAQRLGDLSDPIGLWLAVPAGTAAAVAWIVTRGRNTTAPRSQPEFGDPPPRPRAGNLAAVLVYPGALALAGTANVHGQMQAAVAMAVAASTVALIDARLLPTPAPAVVLTWVLQAGSGTLLPLAAIACLAFLCAPRWRRHGPCLPLSLAALLLLALAIFSEGDVQRQLSAEVRIALSLAAGIAIATISVHKRSAEGSLAPQSPLSNWIQLGLPVALLVGAVALAEDWPAASRPHHSAWIAVLLSVCLTRLALSQWTRMKTATR